MVMKEFKTEGGRSGESRYSNTDHWDFTEEISLAEKKLRRLESKQMVRPLIRGADVASSLI
jgi:hypothetical protein